VQILDLYLAYRKVMKTMPQPDPEPAEVEKTFDELLREDMAARGDGFFTPFAQLSKERREALIRADRIAEARKRLQRDKEWDATRHATR
jgi:hypothetical protein